jgi:hypothetical protein
MKRQVVICSLMLLLGWTAKAGVIYRSFANGGLIPDGSPTGTAETATTSGFLASLSDISVTLSISGGYNGDLYAGLSYGGVLVPLLNRVGVTSGNSFGYGDTGFSVALSSTGAKDVHSYGSHSPSFNGDGQLTGTWQPDGRTIDPQSSPSSFDSASRVGFESFDGMNPNGTWTLFLADLSTGEQSTVVSWSLAITAIPEPTNTALGILAGGFAVCQAVRRWHQRARPQS